MRYFILIVFVLSGNAFSDNIDSSLSLPCLGCHGKSTDLTIPSLYGLEEDYIYNSLTDYKLDKRKNYLMQIISKAYSEHQLKILSYYFSKGHKDNE
tara:strand:+ start:14268 stop:14555 length:288 start_codon:yes stop_codon:yes gene_type:complete